jgi:hypothetical protein
VQIDPNNPVVKLCAEGIAAELQGRKTEAAALYSQAWDAKKDEYEACIAAHYLARIQSTPQEALRWNEEALLCANAVDRDKVTDFYPSLHLNLGKCHEDLGNKDEAKRFYHLAAEGAAMLPEGRLTDVVRHGAAEGLKRVSGSD